MGALSSPCHTSLGAYSVSAAQRLAHEKCGRWPVDRDRWVLLQTRSMRLHFTENELIVFCPCTTLEVKDMLFSNARGNVDKPDPIVNMLYRQQSFLSIQLYSILFSSAWRT